jgi:hypothetical protein
VEAPPGRYIGRAHHLDLGLELLTHGCYCREELELASGRARDQEQGAHRVGWGTAA